MTYADNHFKNVLKDLVDFGVWDTDPRPSYKDGTPAHSKFITDVYVKYPEGITPIISLRHTAWKTGIREILAIYQKQTHNLEGLHEAKVFWWDEFVINPEADYEDKTCGVRYGNTVAKWNLMNKLLDGLVDNPFGRRHILNLYQESDLVETAGLHPCAFLTMFSCRQVKEEMYLDCALVQRSSDYLTAASINSVQYKALQMMVATHCGYKVGTFSHHIMNLHVYDRHAEQAAILATTKGQETEPHLVLNAPSGTNFYDIKLEDFEMRNYKPFKHEPKLFFELAI